jgi:rRNA maturation RNase YbeY
MENGFLSFAYHNVDFQIEDEETVGRWLRKVVNEEGKSFGDLAIVFCTDKSLLKKNVKYLKTNTLTDIIAFDYCEGEIISGDIFISVERVKENAKIYEVSEENEACRVMVHGMLHLIGYKDKNAADKTEMRRKEDYYLSLHPFL